MKYFFLCVYVMLVFFGCEEVNKYSTQLKKDIFFYTLAYPADDTINQTLNIEVLDFATEHLAFSIGDGKSIFEQPKPTILLFLQQDCKNCITQAPYIIQLKEKYQEYLNLFILTPYNEDSLQEISDILKSYNKSYPIYRAQNAQNLLTFLNKDISQGYLAFFDANGNKVIDYVGLVPPEMLERDILFVLQDIQSPIQSYIESDNPQATQDDEQPDSQTLQTDS